MPEKSVSQPIYRYMSGAFARDKPEGVPAKLIRRTSARVGNGLGCLRKVNGAMTREDRTENAPRQLAETIFYRGAFKVRRPESFAGSVPGTAAVPD